MAGRPPKPTAIRIAEGNRERRPINKNEPQYSSGIEPPRGISAAARRIWHSLAGEMAAEGVLRNVDALALAQLCEDQAMLDELTHGLAGMKREVLKKAKEKKLELPGGPLVQLTRSTEGRRTIATIRELSAQIIVQRREFGLTPSSRSRISVDGGPPMAGFDPLEMKLCG